MILVALMVLTAAGETPAQPAATWPEHAFFGLHYDLHANASDTELGRETTYEHIREQLEKVHPDFVQYDCKGHPGYAGYPTEIGSPSPGIVNDALRVWRDVTHDMGIPLSIHFSGVWDTRAIELHPDWARIGPDGKPSPNNTDPLSDYTESLMIPQLIEVVTKYDLDGVWIDGENWASQPSWSERCIAEFTHRTGIEEIPRSAKILTGSSGSLFSAISSLNTSRSMRTPCTLPNRTWPSAATGCTACVSPSPSLRRSTTLAAISIPPSGRNGPAPRPAFWPAAECRGT